MDPRPYNYEYRRPRLSNPTLYFFPYPANPSISTKVFTTKASRTDTKSIMRHLINLPITSLYPTNTNRPLKETSKTNTMPKSMRLLSCICDLNKVRKISPMRRITPTWPVLSWSIQSTLNMPGPAPIDQINPMTGTSSSKSLQYWLLMAEIQCLTIMKRDSLMLKKILKQNKDRILTLTIVWISLASSKNSKNHTVLSGITLDLLQSNLKCTPNLPFNTNWLKREDTVLTHELKFILSLSFFLSFISSTSNLSSFIF